MYKFSAKQQYPAWRKMKIKGGMFHVKHLEQCPLAPG